MKLEVTYLKDGVETVVALTPTDDAVTQASKKLGYQELVHDPDIYRAIELKQAELFSLEPTDKARIAVKAELTKLQEDAQKPIANPVGREAFVVASIREVLVNLLVDEQAIQQEAQQLLEQRMAAQREAAITALGLPPVVQKRE